VDQDAKGDQLFGKARREREAASPSLEEWRLQSVEFHAVLGQ
jgi:hypothetical protein